MRRTGVALRYVWVLATAGSALAPPASADGPNQDIFGQWRVVSILDTADIAGMSNWQAQKLVGKHININENAFTFDGMRCKTPTYDRLVHEPAQYLREQWHARAGKLNLPNPVTVVDARCTDLFLKPGARLVFNWNGFFFEARKE